MRVVTMALIDVTNYFLSAVAVALAFATRVHLAFGYLHALVIFALLYLAVVRVPLVLNWSSNLYGSVFLRVFLLHVVAILTYGVAYYYYGDFTPSFDEFTDAVYFSAITWTTLGYGDFSPGGGVRLLTSLQALTGLTALAVLASVVWLYCERRLRSPGRDEQAEESYEVELDSAFGLFRPADTEAARVEQRNRDRIRCARCGVCGAEARIEKYFDIIGRTTPLPRFVTRCVGCGAFSKPSMNAYVAAWRWNRMNRGERAAS
jgi:hypothetical protein